MKTSLLITLFIIFGSLPAFSKTTLSSASLKNTTIASHARIINMADSVIFDLANATLTATYIDIPVYILSDDVIFALDYAMKFNQAKLTFSTTIDMIPSDTTFSSLSFFNPSDLFARYSGSTFQTFPSGVGVYLTLVRFTLSAPCIPISATDFTNVSALLNGTQCASRVTVLNFSQFVPLASFSSGPACLNAVTQFSDNSTVSSGSIASWVWSFGNGGNSAVQNPVTTYTTGTSTTATLIAYTSAGCSDTLTKQLTLHPTLISTISPAGTTTLCPINSVTLSGPPGMSSYLWSNNAGTPSVILSLEGIYTLQVTDLNGCSAISAPATIVNVLPADFNRNGTVDINDFLIFAPQFGLLCSCPEDLNSDGIVDIGDFMIFVMSFNTSCQ